MTPANNNSINPGNNRIILSQVDVSPISVAGTVGGTNSSQHNNVLRSIMEHDLGSEFTTMKERAMD